MFQRSKHAKGFIGATLLSCSLTATVSAEDIVSMTCPGSPNCVSSQVQGDHFIAPLDFQGQDTATIRDRLLAWLEHSPRTVITQSDGNIIKAKFSSRMMGFVDDLTLIIQPSGTVDVRSASRTGYYDFKVNRKRVEALRIYFQNQ
ncbi:DUF1499 domain-containing protein [Parendozoicomonas sp. Alg238-R29]|uniref:DUF1499 domain-containing protein n=1 Tax=Parendozoicomonas sp. Alg238-R29 TaxID=2993446 RepID=UPI00248ED22F|nr:DUF1499 domain-containing protein [Parendozoicomonas sp. Alg238-R29]